MKIGIPSLRLSKKVLVVSVGMLALLGGTGAAALYVGRDAIIGKPKVSITGGECTTLLTIVAKTPSKRLWLRKYVSMENADGATRIRTALRVAGVLAKSSPVDLVQVNVLDAKGPQKRAEMRGRTIGAEVTIALQPQYLPEGTARLTARYHDEMPTADGRFYGERVELDLADIQRMMTAMKDSPDKEGCTEPEPPDGAAEGGPGVPEGGNHVVSAAGEHGPAASEAHGDGAAGEKSFLDSVLGMVGFGGGEAPAEEGKEAKAHIESGGKADDTGENEAVLAKEKALH